MIYCNNKNDDCDDNDKKKVQIIIYSVYNNIILPFNKLRTTN